MSAMPFLLIRTAPPGVVAAPMQPVCAVFFRGSLIPFAVLLTSFYLLLLTDVAEGNLPTGRRAAPDELGNLKPSGGEGLTPGAVAGKLFDIVSNVVGEVSSEVKSSVLHGLSKLRTSENYKKTKYLLTAPDVSTDSVNARLQRWGLEGLRFLHVYIYTPPGSRAAVIKLAFDEIPQITRFYRKYASLGEIPDAASCYKSIIAVKVMLQSTIEKTRAQLRTQALPQVTDSGTVATHLHAGTASYGMQEAGPRRVYERAASEVVGDVEVRRIAQLLQMVVKVLPRVLFYYIHPFRNWSNLSYDLSLYLGKMLPEVKQIFALAWRLNSVLPARSALVNKRMMVDYVNDALQFEEGLHAAGELRKVSPGEYEPEHEYHHIPPPDPRVLQVAPLSDTL